MTSTGPVNPARSWARLDGVDLLRGLAIFFVLMNHINMRLRGAHVPYTQGLPEQLVSSLVWNGQMGVQIFFAVSGFLITSTALRRWGSLSRVNVRDFYLLRFARIGPLLILLLGALSLLHFAHLEHFVVSAKTGGLGQALFAALTFHVNLLEARGAICPPTGISCGRFRWRRCSTSSFPCSAGCSEAESDWLGFFSHLSFLGHLAAPCSLTETRSGGNIPILAAWMPSRSGA